MMVMALVDLDTQIAVLTEPTDAAGHAHSPDARFSRSGSPDVVRFSRPDSCYTPFPEARGDSSYMTFAEMRGEYSGEYESSGEEEQEEDDDAVAAADDDDDDDDFSASELWRTHLVHPHRASFSDDGSGSDADDGDDAAALCCHNDGSSSFARSSRAPPRTLVASRLWAEEAARAPSHSPSCWPSACLALSGEELDEPEPSAAAASSSRHAARKQRWVRLEQHPAQLPPRALQPSKANAAVGGGSGADAGVLRLSGRMTTTTRMA